MTSTIEKQLVYEAFRAATTGAKPDGLTRETLEIFANERWPEERVRKRDSIVGAMIADGLIEAVGADDLVLTGKGHAECYDRG